MTQTQTHVRDWSGFSWGVFHNSPCSGAWAFFPGFRLLGVKLDDKSFCLRFSHLICSPALFAVLCLDCFSALLTCHRHITLCTFKAYVLIWYTYMLQKDWPEPYLIPPSYHLIAILACAENIRGLLPQICDLRCWLQSWCCVSHPQNPLSLYLPVWDFDQYLLISLHLPSSW